MPLSPMRRSRAWWMPVRPTIISRRWCSVWPRIAKSRAAHAQPFSPPHLRYSLYCCAGSGGISVSLINSIFNAFGSTLRRGIRASCCIHAANPFPPGRPSQCLWPCQAAYEHHHPRLATRDGAGNDFCRYGRIISPRGRFIYTAMADCGLSPQAAQDFAGLPTLRDLWRWGQPCPPICRLN